jgi:hypothetical protein
VKLAVLAVVALLGLLAPRRAVAEVERYAVVIGANRGAPGETELSYAGADADKVADVLRQLGEVPAENLIVLKEQDAASVRRALIAVNERLRARRRGGAEIMLLVYYSGHADARALHLGGTRLELAELEGLVRGSAADLRILLLDACRSGALTRVKGGRPVPAIKILLDERLRSEGVAILSSSSGSEDAQESDEIKGSFFTYYLVSALMGAGDDDGDGQVTLREAYRHAYDRTLLASSRTLSGQQHPSFRFDLKGRGDVVLTRVHASRGRATVSFPPRLGFVVVQGHADGPVVAEVSGQGRARQLSLAPGRYHVVGRADDYMLEGDIALAPDERRALAADELRRVEYARLVRKGGTTLTTVQGPAVGLAVRSSILEDATPCVGPLFGWPIERHSVTITPRVALCRGSHTNPQLDAIDDGVDLELRVTRALDFPGVTFDIGLAGGGGLLYQHFKTRGVAPSNLSVAAHLDVTGGALVELGRASYLAVDLAAQSWFFRVASGDAHKLAGRVALRGALLFGLRL